MKIKHIIANIRAGKFDQETDEKEAGGFWDLAGLLVEVLETDATKKDELQRDICGFLWETYEETAYPSNFEHNLRDFYR